MRLFYPEILRDEADSNGVEGGGGADAGAADAGGDAPPAPPPDNSDMPPKQEPLADDGAPAPPSGSDAPPEAYEPDFSYKVHDEEKEMPDWLKGVVVDAESEAQVRELLERADGLDHVKASRQVALQQLEHTSSAYQSQTQAIQHLTKFVQSGDLQSFFDGLKISEDQVLKYALTRIQYRNATPEQRQAYDAQRDMQVRLANAEAEVSQHRSGAESTAVRQRATDIDISLARPEVSTAAQAYDTRTGKAGSFRQEVINRGLFHWHQSKTDIPVEQAVREVLALMGHQAGQPGVTGAGAGQPGKAAPGVVQRAQAKKPVIPNLAGSGHSPIQVVPKSIKDLRKLAQAAS